jgi:4-hydroxy-tetrahydrodipicolinate synthase
LDLWSEPRWACAALVTPVDAAGRIDVERLARLGRSLLERGLNGLVLFGTMGEGASFPAAERLEAAERLVGLGLDPGRLVLGVASSAPAEAAWMARRAGGLGLAAVLGTPPFFYREVEQEGVYRAYATVVEAAGAEAPPLLLYHIPQVAGVRVEVATVRRLVEGYPGAVRGIKDSEGNAAYTRSLLGEVGARTAVLVGAEALIPEAMGLGARGTICGMANLIPRAIARLVEGDAGGLEPVLAMERALEGMPVIPAVKAAVGERLGEAAAWRACVPPLLPASEEQAARLAELAEPA